jgi:hypothetical protein
MIMATMLTTAAAAAPPVTRTDLQRHDLSIAGHETVQARIDFPPGSLAPPHTHPGEEVIYILPGPLEYQVAGGDWRRYRTGEVLFIPPALSTQRATADHGGFRARHLCGRERQAAGRSRAVNGSRGS